MKRLEVVNEALGSLVSLLDTSTRELAERVASHRKANDRLEGHLSITAGATREGVERLRLLVDAHKRLNDRAEGL